jgi:hypothetical protein
MDTNIDFRETKICLYRLEHYSVRDNGSVLRHPKPGKKQRPVDNIWTFGRLNNKTGYLEIASNVIHRIVATAFHGEPPTPNHVVDHIDTNKHNNRQVNLRWVTRLENILLNPITARRIEIVCGSIEAFLADPSKFRNHFFESNNSWMSTVTAEEARISKERLLAWAHSDSYPSGGSLGDWIYRRGQLRPDFQSSAIPSPSLTENAKQINWQTPCEFPICPTGNHRTSILEYYSEIKPGAIFAKNPNSTSIIEDSALSDGKDRFWVISRNIGNNTLKEYSLAEVKMEGNVFLHKSLGSFFEKIGAEKMLTIEQGNEWLGGETIDELCG